MTGRRRLGTGRRRRDTARLRRRSPTIFDSLDLAARLHPRGRPDRRRGAARPYRSGSRSGRRRWAWCVALLLALTWMFPSGHELLHPARRRTFTHFGELFTQAGQDTRSYGVPVPDRDGLLFIDRPRHRRGRHRGRPAHRGGAPAGPGRACRCWPSTRCRSRSTSTASRSSRSSSGRSATSGCWSPTTSTGSAGSAAASPATAATSTCGNRRRWPPRAGGWAWSAWSRPCCCRCSCRPSPAGCSRSSRRTAPGSASGGLGVGGGRINLFASLSGQLTQSATVTLVTAHHRRAGAVLPALRRRRPAHQRGLRQPDADRPVAVARDCPTRATSPATDGGTYQLYHASVEITDDLRQGLAAGLLRHAAHRQPRRRLVLRPQPAGRLLQPQTTRGKKYAFDYVRPRYTAEAAAHGAAAAPGQPDPDRVHQHAAGRHGRRPGRGADPGQDHGVRQGARALRLLLQGATGSPTACPPSRRATRSDIAAFLKNKVGYCQQYAAALAWMVRRRRHPGPGRLRLHPRHGRRATARTTITNRNAHAWTEVYLQGFGWIPFDATPAGGVHGCGPLRTGRRTPTARPDRLRIDRRRVAGRHLVGRRGRRAATGSDARQFGRGRRARRRHRRHLHHRPGAGRRPVALLLALLLVPALRRALLRRHRHAATRPPTTVTVGGPGTDRDIVVTTEAVHARARTRTPPGTSWSTR